MTKDVGLVSNRRLAGSLAVFVLVAYNAEVAGDEKDIGSIAVSTESQGRLEEVIVTAQRRARHLQQVAASVTALSAEFIDEAGIKDIAELGLYTPGMLVSTNGTSGRVYIRGIGNNLDFLGSQGAVAVYSDGVYQARSWGIFYDFIDIERIEVLRGPQGTLYGRNATGGAINIISATPTDELTAQARISSGNFNELNLRGTLSTPLTDIAKGRISLARKSRDGFTDNLSLGFDGLDDEDLISSRGELQLNPADNVEIRLLGQYLSRDSEGLAIVPTVDGLAASLGAQSNTDPFEVRHNTDTFFKADNYALSAIAIWRINTRLALESISGFGDNTVDYQLDTDGTEVDAIHFANREDHRQFSQELRLYSTEPGNSWDWQAGLYYLVEDTSDSGIVFLPAFGFDIPVGGKIDADAFAVFAQGTYQIGSKLGLTLGIRYSTETKSMTSPVFVDDETSWHDWTPHLSLEYQLNDNAFVYSSVTKGFKSGGYNVLGGGERVNPETVWSYEVGSKSDWLDERLRLNAVIFYARYDDQQVNTFTGAGLAEIDNAAESTIYGFELEASAKPTARTDVNIGVSYLDAEFDRYLAADPFLGAVDLAGSRLSNAPEYSLSFSGNYTLPLESRAVVTAHIDYAWQDDVKYDVFDNARTNQSAYGVGNVGVWYTGPQQHWKVGFWIRNITDEEYFISHASLNFTQDGTISFTGDPRTYGLELSFDY